jgi:hypothetical protein
MAEYETEIQWGGPKAPLHVDADQEINIPDREEVISEDSSPSTGTQVSWGGPDGEGEGSAQQEEPVG